MKPIVILVSVLLTCANTLALAKTPKQTQPVKPEMITTELDPQSKYVRFTKLFRLLGMKPKQNKTPKNKKSESVFEGSSDEIEYLKSKLIEFFESKVEIKLLNEDQGKLEIEFYGYEDLERILNILKLDLE